MKNRFLRTNWVIGLILLFPGIFFVASLARGNIIYVDDDNIGGPWNGTIEYPYQHIQDGINHSSSGDTVFVFNGVYHENVMVSSPIDVVGQNRDSTIIDGGGDGNVVTVYIPEAKICEFTIRNGGSAGMRGTAYVFGNIIMNNSVGILTHSFARIFSNIISNNASSGIYIAEASSNDTIYENIISNNGGGGVNLEYYCNNHNIFRNTITNNLYGVTLPLRATNNVIAQNTIADNEMCGIYLEADANNNAILRNTITNNWTNVSLELSNSNIISENIIMGDYYGIEIIGSSNIISGNTIRNVDQAIFVKFHHNIIMGNNITNCAQGIRLRWSHYNKLIGNTVTDNVLGINLDITSYDTVVSNTIANNTHLGVGIGRPSNSNLLYHNNILNNAQNSEDLGTNIWDNGYPSGGNYWSDYTGVDADSDGIGDTPYNIPGGSNQDRYPLVYIRGDANRDLKIDLGDVVYLVNYVYKNGPVPKPLPAGDVNSDGVVDVTDIAYLVSYLYMGGSSPSET